MTPIWQWDSAFFLGEWTEEEVGAFQQRVEQITVEEAAKSARASAPEGAS